VVEKLLNLGHNVIGIDNFSTGQQKYIEPFIGNKGFILHCEDLVTSKNLTKFIDGANTIFHLAANADIRGGLKHPYKDLEQNTIATFRVLEAMRVAGISRIVFSSTAASLGEPDTFPTPECCPIPIQTSLYGASKMACEGLISACISICVNFGAALSSWACF
jgi:UDP-glucose 4-epimerase